MTRYNIKPDVVTSLKSVTDLKLVSADYPKDWTKMPAAIYSTKAKPNKTDLSKNELLTEWIIKIDLYHSKSLSDMQQKVIDSMKAIGFKNTATDDANTDAFKRVILTFRGIVDNQTLFVYQ